MLTLCYLFTSFIHCVFIVYWLYVYMYSCVLYVHYMLTICIYLFMCFIRPLYVDYMYIFIQTLNAILFLYKSQGRHVQNKNYTAICEWMTVSPYLHNTYRNRSIMLIRFTRGNPSRLLSYRDRLLSYRDRLLSYRDRLLSYRDRL